MEGPVNATARVGKTNISMTVKEINITSLKVDLYFIKHTNIDL